MFIYLDTETTGSGPEDRLCQIAFKTDTGTTVDELFKPNLPISVEAMSIHHITNEMVASTDLDEDLAYTVRHYLGGQTQEPEYDASI